MCIFFFAVHVSYAQQTQLFSQHPFNRTYINPANTGANEALEITGVYRSQWAGLAGSPVYQTIAAEMPIYQLRSGAGITFYNDALGVAQHTAIFANYAYHLSIGEGLLSAGIRAGWHQLGFEGSRLTTPQGEYNDNTIVQHNDGVIPNTDVTGGAPDVAIGIQYQKAPFFAGVSVEQVLGANIQLEGGLSGSSIQQERHINIHAGYRWELNRDFTLLPNVLIRSDFVKNQVDFTLIGSYNRFLRAGIGFRGYDGRSQDAIIAIIGVNLSDQWQFGYSYDYNISALSNVNSGTHELLLKYRMPILRPRAGKIINNPRFLSY